MSEILFVIGVFLMILGFVPAFLQMYRQPNKPADLQTKVGLVLVMIGFAIIMLLPKI